MRTPLEIPALTTAEVAAVDTLDRTTCDVRLRPRAQIVLLAGEQRLAAPTVVRIVREHEETVRRWLKRWLAEGLEGLKDRPMPGGPTKITVAYREQVLAAVRQRPRSLGQPYSRWTLQRLADDLAERTGIRVSYETVRVALMAGGIVLSRPQHTVTSPAQSTPRKKAVEDTRDELPAGDAFSYAAEFKLSWLPALRAMWRPQGQQVMIPPPTQPHRRYGIGAVNYHTGETVVQFQRPKRRTEIAQLLAALREKHPTGTVYVAWDNASTHEDDEVEEVVRAAAGRLVLLSLPTDSPWLNPIEMLWRHFRREVTHGELFASRPALLTAAAHFFARCHREPRKTLSIIGSKAAIAA